VPSGSRALKPVNSSARMKNRSGTSARRMVAASCAPVVASRTAPLKVPIGSSGTSGKDCSVTAPTRTSTPRRTWPWKVKASALRRYWPGRMVSS
jgi:hypothetical protein